MSAEGKTSSVTRINFKPKVMKTSLDGRVMSLLTEDDHLIVMKRGNTKKVSNIAKDARLFISRDGSRVTLISGVSASSYKLAVTYGVGLFALYLSYDNQLLYRLVLFVIVSIHMMSVLLRVSYAVQSVNTSTGTSRCSYEKLVSIKDVQDFADERRNKISVQMLLVFGLLKCSLFRDYVHFADGVERRGQVLLVRGEEVGLKSGDLVESNADGSLVAIVRDGMLKLY